MLNRSTAARFVGVVLFAGLALSGVLTVQGNQQGTAPATPAAPSAANTLVRGNAPGEWRYLTRQEIATLPRPASRP